MGLQQDARGTSDVVWYAMKRYAKRIGIDHLAPTILVAPAPASAMRPEGNSNRFSFSLSRVGANDRKVHWMQAEPQRSSQRSISNFTLQAMQLMKLGVPRDKPVYHIGHEHGEVG
jgi:hypothetical protein